MTELSEDSAWQRDIDSRLRTLENWRTTTDAVNEVRREHMDSRFDKLEAQIAKFSANFMRVVWAIAALVLGAIANFIFQGGLAVVP